MKALVWRELRLAAAGGNALLPLIFFLLVATLFPFAVGPDRPLLARTGGGALWMAALLAALLPVERLVEPDRASGVLDQLAVRGVGRAPDAAAGRPYPDLRRRSHRAGDRHGRGKASGRHVLDAGCGGAIRCRSGDACGQGLTRPAGKDGCG